MKIDFRVFAALLAVFISFAVFAAYQIVSAQAGYAEARKEYDMLRQYAPSATRSEHVNQERTQAPQTASSDAELEPNPAKDLSEINPDYIGWLRIEGAGVDYPVVQGADNGKYLTTSFSGEPNDSGAIFMDAVCTDGFASPFTVIYSHNMDDGSMFPRLNRYVEVEYLAANRELAVKTAEGEALCYSIIGARVIDVSDEAYTYPHWQRTKSSGRIHGGNGRLAKRGAFPCAVHLH